ncbi:MAG: glycerophosphodiester phosphodiesterase family protein [Bdellovibrionota bacterium]|nr:glycerophosphodiester phosphodiesterase family protein [Bdellovibrionota bacterium]
MKSKIIGHRGAKGESPENTLKSIKKALDLGCGGVEIDVHLSRDEHLMVIHDWTLDRTTSGQGKVKDYTLEELKKLNAGEGETIPTLDEVLNLVKGYKESVVLIEIKAPGCEKRIIDCVDSLEMKERSIIKCFHHGPLKMIKDLRPDFKTHCLLYGRPLNPVEIVKAAKGDGLSISHETFDKELVSECLNQGLEMTVWNANTVEDMELFKQMGFHYICTDFPSLFLKK